jgi:hypothetical protein
LANVVVDKIGSTQAEAAAGVRGSWARKILIWFDLVVKVVCTVWTFALVVEQTKTLWPHMNQTFTQGWSQYYLFWFAFSESVVFALALALIVKQWKHQPDRVAIMLQLAIYGVQV